MPLEAKARARPIFLAAPESGAAAVGLIDKLLVQLEIATNGRLKPSDVFSPHLQIGDVGIDAAREAYFTRALTALNAASVVVAVLDGPQVDENVAFLVGASFAAGKRVIALHTDGRAKGAFVDGSASVTVRDAKALALALEGALKEA